MRPLVNFRCRTGENPVWDAARQLVYWADIPEGKLFSCGHNGGDPRVVYSGPKVGGFCLCTRGRLLLFRQEDVVLYDPDTRHTVDTVAHLDDAATQRFNDCRPSPDPAAGGIYAGSIGRDPADLAGGLWHLAPGGRLTCLFRGTHVANGMDFSPEGRTFYWADTTARTVFAFDVAAGGVEPATRRVLFGGDEEDGLGKPDGLIVDVDGGVWVARNGAGVLTRHDPADGRETARVELPVAKVTSACFGGEGLTTLYVTTGGGQGDVTDRPPPQGDDADGTLYAVTGLGTSGRPVPVVTPQTPSTIL